MNLRTAIVEYAREAHRQVWTRGSNVSRQTKSAQAVCQIWQDLVCKEFGDRLVKEHALGADGVNERLDLVDCRERVAYELKASRNNPHMEFYRDVFKALVFNRLNPRNRLQKLVFITPGEGAGRLEKPFTEEVRAIASKAGLEVEIAPI